MRIDENDLRIILLVVLLAFVIGFVIPVHLQWKQNNFIRYQELLKDSTQQTR